MFVNEIAMAILEIKKAKTVSKSGKWFTFNVTGITVIHGEVYLIPENQKYQYMKLMLSDCIIVK